MKEDVTLSLHIPEARFRPGDTPDFSYLQLPKAGEAARPHVEAKASETRELAYGLVRVLDDDGKAVGPWNPELEPETLRRALRAMMLTRAFDDRMFKMQRQGKISFYLKCTGEEAVAVGAAFALEPSDMCFPTYRQQGLLIARDWPLLDMMGQCYSNRLDRLKGRQLPGPLLRAQGRLLFAGRQSRHAISAGGRLGDGVRLQARPQDRRRLDRRGRLGGRRLPPRPHLRRGLPRAGHPQPRQQSVGDLVEPGRRRRRGGDLRLARDRLRPPRHPRRRQRPARRLRGDQLGGGAGPLQSRPDADRAFHLSHGAALDQRRSEPLPPGRRGTALAARRPGPPPQAPPDRAWRMGRGTPRGARYRTGGAGPRDQH